MSGGGGRGGDGKGRGGRDDGPRRREGEGRGRGGPPGRRGDPTPLGEALDAFLRKHGLDEEVEGHAVLERWSEIVGERIAAVTRPTGVARGVLYVEVRSSAWMSELDLMRRDIMARLNAGRSVGRIERILFRLAEDDGPR